MINNLFKSGNCIAVTGPMASGKTLTAVALFKKLRNSNNNTKIISNITINHLKNIEKFDFQNIWEYKNSIIFFDMLEFLDVLNKNFFKDKKGISRADIHFITETWVGFLNSLEENNNCFIFTIQNLRYLYPIIKDFITHEIKTSIDIDKNILYLNITDDSELLKNQLFTITKINDYFQYYNTLAEMISFQDI